MATEKDYKAIKMATLYELRLILSNDGKATYQKEEILQLLDQLAQAKDQET